MICTIRGKIFRRAYPNKNVSRAETLLLGDNLTCFLQPCGKDMITVITMKELKNPNIPLFVRVMKSIGYNYPTGKFVVG